MGRAVVNARVCSSPGRDRELDEMRLQPQSTPPTSPFSLTPSPVGKGRRIGDRKRPQNQECPLSSKTFSQSLSPQKVIHSLEVQLLLLLLQCILGYPNHFGPEVVPRCSDKASE